MLASEASQLTYSKTGFVLAAQSMKSDCSSAAVATSGTAVNQCTWAGDSSYKYQLVQGMDVLLFLLILFYVLVSSFCAPQTTARVASSSFSAMKTVRITLAAVLWRWCLVT